MKRRRTLPAVLGLLLPLFCSAQQNKLVVHPAQQINAKRGTTISQSLDVAVLPGFHVNGDKPKDEFLIPLKLTWTSGPLEAESVTYPKAEEITVGNQSVLVLTGAFQIQTKFQASSTAAPGTSMMTGKLRYQACNNEMCFRPSSVEVHVPVSIE